MGTAGWIILAILMLVTYLMISGRLTGVTKAITGSGGASVTAKAKKG